jgi:hypothetical protein
MTGLAVAWSSSGRAHQLRNQGVTSRFDAAPAIIESKYPPAEPGALGLEPLKAAYGAADAAPERVGHLKVAISATDSSAPGACPPLPVS